MIVLTRFAAAMSLACLAAGCANDSPSLTGYANAGALTIAGPPIGEGGSSPQSYRKTMSDRILAAIALERVTGLKPDPARLGD
jgi:hypothetical protein